MNKTKMETAATEKTGPEAFNKRKAGLALEMMDQWLAEHYQGPDTVPLVSCFGLKQERFWVV